MHYFLYDMCVVLNSHILIFFHKVKKKKACLAIVIGFYKQPHYSYDHQLCSGTHRQPYEGWIRTLLRRIQEAGLYRPNNECFGSHGGNFSQAAIGRMAKPQVKITGQKLSPQGLLEATTNTASCLKGSQSSLDLQKAILMGVFISNVFILTE